MMSSHQNYLCREECERFDDQKNVASTSSSSSSPLSNNLAIKLNDFNSADDISTRKECKDGVSWQRLTELPSIQMMTNFVYNTCHNYRQTMKAVLTGKQSYRTFENARGCHADAYRNNKCLSCQVTNETNVIETNEEEQVEEEEEKEEHKEESEVEKTEQVDPNDPPRTVSRKRGRPPKVGTSKRFKRIKRYTRESFFHGKLRNVCHQRRKRRDDNDSDLLSD